MTSSKVHPVILCGGSGTRLWPLSRKSYPKQFVELTDEKSLFEATLARFSGSEYGQPTILTSSDFRFIADALAREQGTSDFRLVIEPEGKNTAPAVLVAALLAHKVDPGALVLVAPADHRMPNNTAFRAAVEKGIPEAENGQIVTFGVRPTRVETGYGYLLTTDTSSKDPQPLKTFIEKPDAESARAMVNSGRHLWNAGIFLARADTLLSAFEEHAPTVLTPVRNAVESSTVSGHVVSLDGPAWARVPDISFDYAVMEYAANVTVVPFAESWNDLGGWDAVWNEMDKNAEGVAVSGNVTELDCQNSLLRSESDNVELVGIGLKNVIAVAMDDAVLVAEMSDAQKVKDAVACMKERKRSQATQQKRDYRPWGWYESLIMGRRFQVKRIVVEPGAALSLQSHVHRSEHWIVVEGTAEVTINDTKKLVAENESVYIPLGAVHRMENPGKVRLVLIEVQTGAYLGEDDIVRFEDVYERA